MITRAEFLTLAASAPLWARQQQPLTPEVIKQKQEAWEAAIKPPMATVFKSPTATLYSSSINAITSWMDVGAVTWLGTLQGVKRVEKGQPPKHYTALDGLPNGYINWILGDENGVFVFLLLNGEEHIYSLDSKTDRWKELARWPMGRLDQYSGSSPGFLALNKEVIIASPRVVSTKDPEPLFCYDRERGERRSLPWSTVIQSDHQRLIISFVHCQEKTVLLGTNIGLIEVPLSADGGPWTRRLADFSVSRGLLGKGSLYLWLNKRQPGLTRETLENTGAVHYIDTARWEAQSLPPSNLPAQSRATIDDQGALWVVAPQQQGGAPIIFFGQGGGQGMFHRWKPGTATWQVYRADGSDAAGPAPAPQPIPFNLPVIAKEDVIPEAPARLASLDDGRLSYFNIGQLNTQGMGFSEPSMALQWIRARFPHWLSSDVSKELLTVPEIRLDIYAFALAEPGKTATAWTGAPGALLAVAAGSLSGKVLPPEGKPENAPWRPFLPELPQLPLQQKATLPEATFLFRPGIRRMLPLENGRWLAYGSRPFLIDKNGTRWQEIAWSREFRGIDDLGAFDYFFALGPRQEIYAALFGSKKLQRVDPKTRRLMPTEVQLPQNADFIGASASGAWWRGYDKEMHRLLPDGKNWQKYRLPVLKGFEPQYLIHMAAGRLWQLGYEDRQYVMRGWSPETNTWSDALPTSDSYSLQEDSPGSCLVLTRQNSGQQFTLHRWAAKNGRWTQLDSFAPKLPEGDPILVDVDDKAIWISTAQALNRWDRQKKTLQSFPLPTTDRVGKLSEATIRAEKDAFFLVSLGGLWRLDRKRYTWSNWTVPVPSSQITPKVAVSDSEAIWGTLEALSSSTASVFRFVPKTNRFTFLDKSKCIPEDGKGRLASDGASAWILHPNGAYHYDTATGRFVLVAPGIPIALARDAGGTWISVTPQKSGEPTLWYRKDADGNETP